MPEVGVQALAVLLILLPGFLCARIVRSLCIKPQQTELDKIIEALIYSLLIYVAFSVFVGSIPVALRVESNGGAQRYLVEARKAHLVILLAFAVLFAIGLSAITNNDLFGRLLRKLRITQRTARGFVWGDTFQQLGGHALIELSDGRNIIGWIHFYPDTSEEGTLFLEDAAWVNSNGTRTRIQGPGILITKDAGIKTIAFLDSKQLPDCPVSQQECPAGKD